MLPPAALAGERNLRLEVLTWESSEMLCRRGLCYLLQQCQ